MTVFEIFLNHLYRFIRKMFTWLSSLFGEWVNIFVYSFLNSLYMKEFIFIKCIARKDSRLLLWASFYWTKFLSCKKAVYFHEVPLVNSFLSSLVSRVLFIMSFLSLWYRQYCLYYLLKDSVSQVYIYVFDSLKLLFL